MLSQDTCAGCCFLFGGTRFKEQSFNMMVNKACCSLLFMAWCGPSGLGFMATNRVRVYGYQ